MANLSLELVTKNLHNHKADQGSVPGNRGKTGREAAMKKNRRVKTQTPKLITKTIWFKVSVL